ncbi:type II toxin-antitoxin system HicA family toxin [Thermococcus sp.]
MSKTLKADKVRKALVKKGFKEKKSRHLKFTLYINGKKQRIWTVMSHSGKDIPVWLQKRMMKQLKFEAEEDFYNFVKCPMSYEDYVSYLEKRGHL